MNSYRQPYSSLSSSYHQDASYPKSNIALSSRYGSIDRLASTNHRKSSSSSVCNSFSSSTFATKRSTSYGSGTKLNDIGGSMLRRYDNDHIPTYERRTSYTPSHYSTSGYASSYGTLPRYNRSQTPSYKSRERNYALKGREYKSMSRFSSDRERSEPNENVEQRFEKLYSRYVRDQNPSTNNPSSDETKAYSDKYISYSENETEADEEELSVDESEFKDDVQFKTPRGSEEKDTTPVEEIPFNNVPHIPESIPTLESIKSILENDKDINDNCNFINANFLFGDKISAPKK
uniref:Uncharacterized protein n=1 Tax=Setaria digitata TaxID=48799 RepID=A0A915PJJ1_9BILA